ncbi:MAG: hypothetical protein ACFFFK_11295 [Candidatus Thorarchaeota archaeon]
MNFLKKKVIKTIPAWMIIVIMIGTAAGAVFWISNLISTNVTVTNPPLEISGSFESVHYVGMERVSTFTYTLNDPIMATGYIILDITQMGMTQSQVGGVTARVFNDMGGDMTGAVADIQTITEGYRWVLCDSSGMIPFDFGELGMATAGVIYIGITFENIGTYGVSMQISQTAP